MIQDVALFTGRSFVSKIRITLKLGDFIVEVNSASNTNSRPIRLIIFFLCHIVHVDRGIRRITISY